MQQQQSSSGTVVVTGGAGYIGAHACKALASAGHLPVTFDNLCAGHADAVRWGPLEVGDILDTARFQACLAHHKPSAVIHFAAVAYVGESVADPAKYYRNNVAGTLSVLEAMRAENVGRLVYSSTCATYGLPSRLPISELSPQQPINPYGATKLAAERMIADFRAAYGLRAVVLRYFNAAGADPDGEIGEAHDPETHVVPLLLDTAAGRRETFHILGTSHATPDGTAVRDYVHVSDLAAAHVLALAATDSATSKPAYNLGTGTGVSVAELIRVAERVTGRPIATSVQPPRTGDPPELVADATQVQRDLGWIAVHSDIEKIVQTAWTWHCKQKDRMTAAAMPTPKAV